MSSIIQYNGNMNDKTVTLNVNQACDCTQPVTFSYFVNEILKAGYSFRTVYNPKLKKQSAVYKDHTLYFDHSTLSSVFRDWCITFLK